MAYILVRMHLTPHAPFETRTMAQIFIKMHLVFHVIFKTLIMTYISFKTCLALTVINILVKMQLSGRGVSIQILLSCKD
jgi:hypothetical protein